jgi:hypothetical protein
VLKFLVLLALKIVGVQYQEGTSVRQNKKTLGKTRCKLFETISASINVSVGLVIPMVVFFKRYLQ